MVAQRVVVRMLALGALRFGRKVLDEVFRELEQKLEDRATPRNAPKLKVLKGGKQ